MMSIIEPRVSEIQKIATFCYVMQLLQRSVQLPSFCSRRLGHCRDRELATRKDAELYELVATQHEGFDADGATVVDDLAIAARSEIASHRRRFRRRLGQVDH